MTRINHNIASLNAINKLVANNDELSLRLERLSSGLRINSGADDPAGLIASENLRSEINSTNQAIENSIRANSVIATAEGALNEVSALLLDIQDLVVNSANTGGLSNAEIEANQLQVDSAVESITRIANSTTFQGKKLLDGSQNFVTQGFVSTDLVDLNVKVVRFGTASSVPVNVERLVSAQTASLDFVADGLESSNSVTLEVAGNKGVEVFSFVGSTAASAISFAINNASDVTGVSAILSTGGAADAILFRSQRYGTNAFVSIEALNGTFGLAGGVTRDSGVDATVVINGVQAVADGLDVSINSPALTLDVTLATAYGDGTDASATTSFDITGGGANFQLGPRVDAQQQQVIGLRSIAAHRLGNSTDGLLSDIKTGGSASLISGNAASASLVLSSAVNQVTQLRGELGAFQKNVLDTNISSLQVTVENLTSSESAIRDADFAAETAALTRAQILVQASTAVLMQANAAPQNVLALLR